MSFNILQGEEFAQQTEQRSFSSPAITHHSNQGGERLGDETSGSERKGVMQWTGSELKSETKRKRYAAKFGDLIELKEEFSIRALLLFITMAQEAHSPVLIFHSPVLIFHSPLLIFHSPVLTSNT